MRTIKIAAAAQTDLVEIAEYIAQDNPEAARKIIKEITAKFALLRDNPFIGREQNRILVNLRSFAVKKYVIFYQPSDDGVEILRVLHGSRDIENLFKEFFDSI